MDLYLKKEIGRNRDLWLNSLTPYLVDQDWPEKRAKDVIEMSKIKIPFWSIQKWRLKYWLNWWHDIVL